MEKQQLKCARGQMNQIGVTVLAYYALMNLAVICVMILDMIGYLIDLLVRSAPLDLNAMMEYVFDNTMTNGWGYILSILIGSLIVLAWKGRGFWRNEVFEKSSPMTVGAFFQILCVFLSAQLVSQIFSTALEYLLNLLGLSAVAAVEMATTTGGSFSMYLYACILGPIAEELLFRGLVLRTLKPWGKQTAILFSALVFALFHGNIIQIPFAFAVGLVLAYVTVEYSILWAIALHIINNMVIADALNRLLLLLPEMTGAMLANGIFVLTAIVAVVVLIGKHRQVRDYLRQNKCDRIAIKAAFTSPVLLIFMVLMLVLSLLTITPL